MMYRTVTDYIALQHHENSKTTICHEKRFKFIVLWRTGTALWSGHFVGLEDMGLSVLTDPWSVPVTGLL